MSSCDCVLSARKPPLVEAGEKVISRAGLTEVASHLSEINRQVTVGHSALRRDERAAALGLAQLGGRTEAERSFTQIRKHVERARSLLREQHETDTWREASRRVDELRDRKELRAALDDGRAVLVGILEKSDLAGPDAREIANAWEQTSSQLEEGGVDQLFKWADQRLAQMNEVLTEPADWGRRQHSPLEWWQWLIIIGVLVIAVATLVVCLIWFGCSWIYAVFAALCWGLLATGGWAGFCVGIVF